jgi:hypothetical protein
MPTLDLELLWHFLQVDVSLVLLGLGFQTDLVAEVLYLWLAASLLWAVPFKLQALQLGCCTLGDSLRELVLAS